MSAMALATQRAEVLRSRPRTALILGAWPTPLVLPPGALSSVDVYSVDGVCLPPSQSAGSERLVAVSPAAYPLVRERCHSQPHLEVFVGHPERFAPSERLLRSFGHRAQPLRQLVWRRRSVDRVLAKFPVHERLNAYLRNQRELAFDVRVGFNFEGGGLLVALQLAVAQGHRELLLYGLGDSAAGGRGASTRGGGHPFRAALEPALVRLQVFLEPREGRLIDCTPGSPLQWVQHRSLDAHLSEAGGAERLALGERAP